MSYIQFSIRFWLFLPFSFYHRALSHNSNTFLASSFHSCRRYNQWVITRHQMIWELTSHVDRHIIMAVFRYGARLPLHQVYVQNSPCLQAQYKGSVIWVAISMYVIKMTGLLCGELIHCLGMQQRKYDCVALLAIWLATRGPSQYKDVVLPV